MKSLAFSLMFNIVTSINRISIIAIVIALMAITPFTVYAQKVKTVKGEYTYIAPFNVSIEQAKTTALERAMVQAIANEFGTIVSQHGSTQVINSGTQSSVSTQVYSSSDVKGEWIETIGEPQYDISTADNMLVVTVKVKGKARELVNAGIDIDVKILRNGTDNRFEDDTFYDGDDLYISFQSPIDGYLVIYLADENDQSFCLLPYRSQNLASIKVEAGKRYVFGSQDLAPSAERQIVDEYVMTAARSIEMNRIYAVFSPSQFTKAIDMLSDNGYLPRVLDFAAFDRWLVKNRKHDTQMVVKVIPITVKK